MPQKKYAFLVLGPDYSPEHRARFIAGGLETRVVTVTSFEAARGAVMELLEDGVGALELCGAFGPERTRELIALTGGKMAIGYVTHFPEQDALFEAFFGA